MNTISFMLANFVARPVKYNMTEGWGQGDKATNDYFKPIKTFAERFETYLLDAKNAGFSAIDLWLPILNPAWATDDHITTASDLLKEHKLTVSSIAGGFGDTLDYFELCCDLATAVGAPILGGVTSLLAKDREGMVELLNKYGVKFGYENHPEKTPEEILGKIGKGFKDVIGITVDTGWFGTQGYDAPDALEKLLPRTFHLHLKDVKAVGGHDTCRYGDGVVNIEACVQTLKRLGYTGGISVEHEPDHHDPLPDVKASLEMLKNWLA